MLGRRPLWSLALVVALSAACTSDARDDASRTTGAPAPTVELTAVGPGSSATPTRVADAPSSPGAAEVRIERAPRDFWQFRTPSGNIGCAISPEDVLCELVAADWAAEQPPTACGDADWNGRAVAIDAQETRVGICTTDTVLATDVQVLGYDTGLVSGDLQCVSRRDGLTCRHLVAERGFTVSQARLTLF